MHVGVVGAGISGLVAATQLLRLASLESKHLTVTVFEWGRGPGGRTARKRVTLEDGTEISFDHAAPYFTSKSDQFATMVSEWTDRGLAAPWRGRFLQGSLQQPALSLSLSLTHTLSLSLSLSLSLPLSLSDSLSLSL